MSNVIFDGAGFKAEQLAVAQFGGKLLSDKANQYKDIDAQVTSKQAASTPLALKTSFGVVRSMVLFKLK